MANINDNGEPVLKEGTTDESGDYKIAGKINFSNDSVRTGFTYTNMISNAIDIWNGALGRN